MSAIVADFLRTRAQARDWSRETKNDRGAVRAGSDIEPTIDAHARCFLTHWSAAREEQREPHHNACRLRFKPPAKRIRHFSEPIKRDTAMELLENADEPAHVRSADVRSERRDQLNVSNRVLADAVR